MIEHLFPELADCYMVIAYVIPEQYLIVYRICFYIPAH